MNGTVMIASGSFCFRRHLTLVLQDCQFEVVDEADSLEELLYKAMISNPEIVVIDCAMEQVDMMSLLQYFNQQACESPSIIFVVDDATMLHLPTPYYGINCSYLHKRFTRQHLMIVLQRCLNQRKLSCLSQEEVYENKVVTVLQQMRVSPHMFGYLCLRDGITQMILHPDYHQVVTKVVYADIAMRNNTTKTHVERAMRSTIEHVWEHGDREVLKHYFGYGVDGQQLDSKRPSNARFMATVAEALRKQINMLTDESATERK